MEHERGSHRSQPRRPLCTFRTALGAASQRPTRPAAPSSLAGDMPSHKRFKVKVTLAKKMKQNRPIPNWIRMRTDNKIR